MRVVWSPIRLIAVGALAAAVGGCVVDDAVYGTGRIVSTQSGSPQNIASLTEVVKANPQDPSVYNIRGTAYGRAGRNKDALADFDQAIALDPNYYQAYANRALVHRRMNNDDLAVTDYSTALRINPNYDTALVGRGNIYRNRGDNERALADFNAAIRVNSGDPRAYHNRALIYQSQNLHSFAVEDFGIAIGLDPKAPEPYNGRGVSYLATGDVDAAIEDFNQALQARPRLCGRVGQPRPRPRDPGRHDQGPRRLQPRHPAPAGLPACQGGSRPRQLRPPQGPELTAPRPAGDEPAHPDKPLEVASTSASVPVSRIASLPSLTEPRTGRLG